jgi:hypothetical protein
VAVLCTQKLRPLVKAPPAEVRPIPEALDQQITVKLTATEREAFKIRAILARVTEAELARRFLVQAGVFDRPRT